MVGWIILAIVVGFLAYVRLAPSDVARFHVVPEVTSDKDMAGGAKRVIAGDAEVLAKLDAIAMSTPRTKVLAGSVSEGHVTYITRSRLIGFPDYTTLYLDAGRLMLFARLRFGRSDLGVNRARLEGWLKQLG